MAAYAALVTLINLMEDMKKNHPRFSLDKKQIKLLDEKVQYLLNFIVSYSFHRGSQEDKDLVAQIASAAHAAEDVIESHIVDQILTESTGGGLESNNFLRDITKKVREKLQSKKEKANLAKVIEEMACLKKQIEMKSGFKDELPNDYVIATASKPLANRNTIMVGFEEELIQLMDVLTAQRSNLQIISIVGMGGIGKTTLARNAFENSLIVQYFDFRAWATVSQECSVREILLGLLSYEGKSRTETDSELGEQLYKNLLGKRYLIVLDDVWSVDAWDEIRLFLPDNGHRSRIVVTTRLSNMASHLSCSSFALRFLDNDESWKLLCEKAFVEEDCPPELVEIGKQIVGQCQGLPLSIVVIGGYLSKSSRTRQHWEYIADDINTILRSGEDDHCLKILSLSYNHLPVYLKPCFLYMGVFDEDEDISVSEIIQLWVAEGFLKPSKVQSPEEIAECYLKDLVDRNLILVSEWGHSGEVVSCKIHDLLRELCLNVAEKEKFLCVLKLRESDTPRPINGEHRVAIHGGILDERYCNSELFHALQSATLVRSLKCYANTLPFCFKLVKVQSEVSDFPHRYNVNCLEARFDQQVNLRYLRHNLYFSRSYFYPYLYLPSSMSLLWNLQTLILGGNFERMIAPLEIWKMAQVRHLVFNLIRIPDPPLSNQQHCSILGNLQTLSKVENFRLTEEVCKRIPNIKKLQIKYGIPFMNTISDYCSHNLGLLCKLESLTCSFAEERISHSFALSLTLPRSLRELCLVRCFLCWEDLTMIGSLPCLEVLKLRFSVKGNEWNPVEGEFRSLKYLEIWRSDDFINWNAESFHYPVLESLAFRGISKLEEIPLGIGEIPTLRHIQLDECSVLAAISAMRMLVEQESLGNHGLQLKVRLWHQEDHERFKEMVEEEGLRSNNLRLSNYVYVSHVEEEECD